MEAKRAQMGLQGGKRKFKSGQSVQYEGLYADDWGDRLHLLQGDQFPSNPQMGDTRWTYTGSNASLSLSSLISGGTGSLKSSR